MLKNIIYVVGSPRSGSSLIYNALCSHEKFNPAIPENHLVTNLSKNFFKQNQRNNNIEESYYFDNIKDTKSYFKNCLEIFFNKISKKYSVNYLALKSITLTTNINILNTIYPEINYVMTIRDPRDIIVSMISVGSRQEKLNMQNQFPRNIELLCQKINRFYWFFLEKKQEKFLYEKVYLIKYEDFIYKPLDMLNQFKKKFLLDIVYNNNLDIWRKSSNTYKKNSEDIDNPYKSDLWNQPLNNSRIGIYKEKLKNNEINQINSYCKDIIEMFDYY